MSSKLKKAHLVSFIALALNIVLVKASYATDFVQFNIDVLDLDDRDNIDLNQFSMPGYIMPGTYTFKVRLNNESIGNYPITYYQSSDVHNQSEPCILPDLVNKWGLKPAVFNALTWQKNHQCLVLNSLPGVEAKGDLASESLNVTIPQAYLEYRSETWEPASMWDDGISGVIFDYNITGQMNSSYKHDHKYYNINGNGVVGANLGRWRLRADWQGRSNHSWGNTSSSTSVNAFDLSRIYAYTALSAINAKLAVGENYLNSSLFDTFRYTGISLNTDLNMLPPNLRGYAPEVTGVAATNATVIISQSGRVIYQTQVPAGPFAIQDLPSGISGQLDVEVQEQNGSVQNYQVNTANIPYLTRPGQVRYSAAIGRPSDIRHRTNGELFLTGEFSWGVSSGWSVFGGSINSENYDALALGVGRDLDRFGAVSVDFTQSFACLPMESMRTGGSLRLNYSKRFDEYNSQIQFAGYRFTQRNFISMADYLAASSNHEDINSSKELYTVSLNKTFGDGQMSVYFNYDHQTYWNASNSDRYSIMASKYFDFGAIKQVSTSLSAYRQVYNKHNNDGLFLSFSIPLSSSSYLGYSLSATRDETINQANYYNTIDNKTSYQLSAGHSNQGATASGYITHQADSAQIIANASYINNEYVSFGIGLKGGLTVTADGADLHRVSRMGGTRLLVDTDKVAGIPVKGNGPEVRSNRWGKAVLADINSYYKNKIKIDLNRLPDDAEVTDSVQQLTLTDGAIGYRKFIVLSGQKRMINLQSSDGGLLPFGAQIVNRNGQETGIIDDNSLAYISGIKPNEQMFIKWSGKAQCSIEFPAELSDDSEQLTLTCEAIAE
ncbi:outer membrane usher protein FimD/PapC [Orbus hercynius]|uniref:Outer membrane usher protein FimD/PapC n=1 Tax=Orbus hercynius TaxID=593135 RepID=A0A495RDU1_9GAMM|nr:fimbria/pilus outer membrane usher protein [Orbus hercynius]RKS85118.1 outer membrane usher protein FimD/PapC [Orbus hercynius]